MNQFCEAEILEKLNTIQGISNSKDTLLQYSRYVSLTKNKKIQDVGNSNIIIECEEDYINRKELINLIVDILDTDSVHYLTKKELRNSTFFNRLDYEVYIVDGIELQSCLKFNIDDIKYRTNANKNKTFIIVSCDLNKQELLYLSDCFCWHIIATSSTLEEKQTYIKNKLKINGIKVSNDCNYISVLSDNDMSVIETQLINTIITCKFENIDTITEGIVSKYNLLISNTENEIKSKRITSNKKTALEELDELIGLEDVKSQVRKIVNYVKTNKDRHRQIMLHMALLGNAGCGKNELARIIGRIYKEQGILSKGDFIEISRVDLVAGYIGQSALKTKEVIEKAKGSVLFIDEAYSLNPDGSQKDFGHEVIAELIKAMEDYRNDLCIIFAGYTEEIEQLLKVNRGFNSRVPFKIYFNDYTADELYNIFREMAKSSNYKLAGNIKPVLVEYFEQARQRENFGNGRFARNLLDKVGIEQAQRVATDIAEDKDTIKLCDVKNVLDNLEIVEPKKIKIGFAI